MKLSASDSLSSKKEKLFLLITFIIPVLFFVLLESGLRLLDYKGDLSLFVYPQGEFKGYVLANPHFAKRYFFNTKVIPGPGADPFLEKKPENGFRVFVLGASSAMGYPYGRNVRFSKYFEQVLNDVMPDKHIEVVNLGISAVNTYTIYDQVDEILEQKPDAILIYAGHNEFYGALGVASTESLGAYPAFVRFYLRIQRLKTFLLLRDGMTKIGEWMHGKPQMQGTLMEQVVREQEIPYQSVWYEMGKRQLESNLNAIIDKFSAHHIPVYLSSLASNQKDQKPFISKKNKTFPSAQNVFESGWEAFSKQDFMAADSLFTLAKDLDALRFRASSEFNDIIKKTTQKPGIFYVPGLETMKEASPHGIIGNELLLEHLHPNGDGYAVLGKAFALAFLEHPPEGITIQKQKRADWKTYKERLYITDFDKEYGAIKIESLKSGWPFVDSKSQMKPFVYHPKNETDSMAYLVFKGEIDWEQAKVNLAKRYLKQNKPDLALKEFMSITVESPYRPSAFVFAAQILIGQNQLLKANILLEKANLLEESAYIKKMLGTIQIAQQNYDAGVQLLEKSLKLNPKDPQTLFNLSGGYAYLKKYDEALKIAEKVKAIDPDFPDLNQWMNQLKIINQNK